MIKSKMKKYFETLRNKITFVIKVIIIFGLVFIIDSLIYESSGIIVYSQTDNKSSSIQNDESNQKVNNLRKVIFEYFVTAKKGRSTDLDALITVYDYELEFNDDELEKTKSSKNNKAINLIFKNPAFADLDYEFVKKYVPELIYKHQLYINELDVRWADDSHAIVCVNSGYKNEPSRFTTYDYHLVRKENENWRIFYIEAKSSTTRCASS